MDTIPNLNSNIPSEALSSLSSNQVNSFDFSLLLEWTRFYLKNKTIIDIITRNNKVGY